MSFMYYNVLCHIEMMLYQLILYYLHAFMDPVAYLLSALMDVNMFVMLSYVIFVGILLLLIGFWIN